MFIHLLTNSSVKPDLNKLGDLPHPVLDNGGFRFPFYPQLVLSIVKQTEVQVGA